MQSAVKRVVVVVTVTHGWRHASVGALSGQFPVDPWQRTSWLVVQMAKDGLRCDVFRNFAHCTHSVSVSAKVHYTDTGYGHHQRTSSQQFYNLLYNKFTTNGQKFATSPDILTCRDVGLWHCDVANLLQNCCELGGVLWWCCTTCPQSVSVQWSLGLNVYSVSLFTTTSRIRQALIGGAMTPQVCNIEVLTKLSVSRETRQ